MESENYRELVKEAEERLSKAFEEWLSKQSEERLKWMIRNIWYHSGILRICLLPYNEILKEVKK
jgi:hypothetical protein